MILLIYSLLEVNSLIHLIIYLLRMLCLKLVYVVLIYLLRSKYSFIRKYLLLLRFHTFLVTAREIKNLIINWVIIVLLMIILWRVCKIMLCILKTLVSHRLVMKINIMMPWGIILNRWRLIHLILFLIFKIWTLQLNRKYLLMIWLVLIFFIILIIWKWGVSSWTSPKMTSSRRYTTSN